MKKAFVFIFIVCILSLIISVGAYAQKKSTVKTDKKSNSSLADTLAGRRIIRIDPFRLELVPPSSGVQFYRYGLVFLSNSKNESNMLKSHTSFGNVGAYYAPFQDSLLGRHTLFSKQASFDVPCEGMTFNSDFTVMYFSMRPGKSEPEKIYRAEYKSSGTHAHEWIADPKPLNICTGKYTYSHPALSEGGDTLVFSSNRDDSFGGFDLYVSYNDGTSWSQPLNMGDKINTARDELFPFLDSGNNLYFSSNGHQGFGGQDLFICELNGNGWKEPVNLSKEINTSNDEIAFTMDRSENKTAFYTSKAQLGKESLKLRRITLANQNSRTGFQSLPNALEYIAKAGTVQVEEQAPVAEVTLKQFQPPKENEKVTAEQSTKREKTSPAQPAVKTQTQVNQPKKVAADTTRVVTSVTGKPEPRTSEKVVIKEKPAETKPPSAEKSALSTKTGTGVVVYRVQFSSSKTPRGSFEISFGGSPYKTFEYSYYGMYRSCVGEFSSPSQAAALQKIVMKEGFPDAFVAAFKDNVRSTDASLFK
jgi:hypothetical protein